MIIIYSQNTILLYMFRASSDHLQEDTVVYMQHMVLSLSMRVPGGLSVHSLSENCLWGGGRLVGRQSMPPAAFELVIPASERPQAHALDRAADGIGTGAISSVK